MSKNQTTRFGWLLGGTVIRYGGVSLLALSKVASLIAMLGVAYPAWASSSGAAVLVGAADIGDCNRWQDEATAELLDNIEGTIFTAGDHAYPDGTARQFEQCYGPNWGRHRSRTRPAPGNHDYRTAQGQPYFSYFGVNAGPRGRGYYSYNLNGWHIISLNSNTVAGSWGIAQEEWLRKDLAAVQPICSLAYWHHPFFSSGRKYGNSPWVYRLFKILQDYRVSILVSGHEHIYERFAPQDFFARSDSKGVRQFVVGTGGGPLYEIGLVKPNSEVRRTDSHGVIKFTLHATSYDWEFISIKGQTFRDKGSAPCSGVRERSRGSLPGKLG